MRRSLTLSLGLHAGLLGAAVWFLGEQPEPRRAPVGMLIVRQPRPEPESMVAPRREPPVRPADPPEPLEPDPLPPPELEPRERAEPPVTIWSLPVVYARLPPLVRGAKRAAQTPPAPAKKKPTARRRRSSPPALVGARPAKGRCAPVEYPSRARRLGLEGRVLLRVRIAVDGRADQVTVLKSSGHPSLDGAARTAVARWHFLPATRGGRAVAQWVRVPIEFRIRNRN